MDAEPRPTQALAVWCRVALGGVWLAVLLATPGVVWLHLARAGPAAAPPLGRAMAWWPWMYLFALPLGVVSYVAVTQLDKRRRRAFQQMALGEACFVCGQLQQPAGGTCSECGDHPTAHVHLREPQTWPPVWGFGASEWRALLRAFRPHPAQRYGWACWGGLVKATSMACLVGGFLLFWTGWDRSIMPIVLGVVFWSAAVQITIRHLELRPERAR